MSALFEQFIKCIFYDFGYQFLTSLFKLQTGLQEVWKSGGASQEINQLQVK